MHRDICRTEVYVIVIICSDVWFMRHHNLWYPSRITFKWWQWWRFYGSLLSEMRNADKTVVKTRGNNSQEGKIGPKFPGQSFVVKGWECKVSFCFLQFPFVDYPSVLIPVVSYFYFLALFVEKEKMQRKWCNSIWLTEQCPHEMLLLLCMKKVMMQETRVTVFSLRVVFISNTMHGKRDRETSRKESKSVSGCKRRDGWEKTKQSLSRQKQGWDQKRVKDVKGRSTRTYFSLQKKLRVLHQLLCCLQREKIRESMVFLIVQYFSSLNTSNRNCPIKRMLHPLLPLFTMYPFSCFSSSLQVTRLSLMSRL